MSVQVFLFLVAAAALISAGLAIALRPLFVRYALAHPNERSSHRTPTPQGGGIPVIAGTIIAVAATLVAVPFSSNDLLRTAIVFASAVALAVVGAADDIRPLGALPRLALQAVAILVITATLPSSLRVICALPWWIERGLIFLFLLWFVNLVNFMDGIDWITVAEMVPITSALSIFGIMGALPAHATSVSFALCGALIGFAPFNRPVARLFLGDVGSLPIGLLVGWLLILLSSNHLVAALLLPLYYISDATITLLFRLLRRERVTQPHRNHFYQRALDAGTSVYKIVGSVLVINVALACLAALALQSQHFGVQVALLIIGGTFVAGLLWQFTRYGKSNDLLP